MDKNKKIARTIGILFIIGTIAGILSAVLTGSIFGDVEYLKKTYENQTQVIAGSLLVLVMAFALAMIPVVLFPIFRKFNETLALGAVVFRGILEAVVYVAIAVAWLILVTVSKEYATADAAAAASLLNLGIVLQAVVEWSVHILAIVFSLGTLIVYYLFFISKLIPRWLSIWGIIGAILYLTVPLTAMFNIELGLLMVPLALQEMVLAIWLLIKGFNPVRSAASLNK